DCIVVHRHQVPVDPCGRRRSCSKVQVGAAHLEALAEQLIDVLGNPRRGKDRRSCESIDHTMCVGRLSRFLTIASPFRPGLGKKLSAPP
ncbi:MAG: hypothetical protein QOH53_1481, partial [Ilumatobacteraceae bacterium]